MIIEDVVGQIPWEAGPVVGICRYENVLILACQHRVYRLTPDFHTDSLVAQVIARAPPMPDPI